MIRITALLTLSLSVCTVCVEANQIYKYQDANGRWHFTDKKPASLVTEEVQLETKPSKFVEPSITTELRDGQWVIVANNPYHGPLEVAVKLNDAANGIIRKLVQANSELVLLESVEQGVEYEKVYMMGDPSAQHDNSLYHLPVRRNIQHLISQAFSGRFSHQQEPNVYAVDFALPVGSEILAARSGVVMHVQDNYVLDGTDVYFIDKANLIKVLHSDGTMGIYAHLLAGGAKVSAGQKVNVGDVLGLSGSTGFSTGPHLHFVIWRNQGLKMVSVPFQFTDNGKSGYLPASGAVLEP